MKTIGIIGGLGPQATIDFEIRLHKASQKLIPQFENQGYPQVVVYYLRHAPMKLNPDGSVPSKLEPHPSLLKVAKIIGSISDFLVIPSNTPHLFIENIEKAAGKKVLSIAKVTIDEIKKRRDKKVGIIAIGKTSTSKLYVEPLKQMGIICELIPRKIQDELDREIFKVMEGREDEKSRKVAISTVEYLKRKAVESIILGCSELPLLLENKMKDPNLMNPAQLLAEAAVKFAIFD